MSPHTTHSLPRSRYYHPNRYILLCAGRGHYYYRGEERCKFDEALPRKIIDHIYHHDNRCRCWVEAQCGSETRQQWAIGVAMHQCIRRICRPSLGRNFIWCGEGRSLTSHCDNAKLFKFVTKKYCAPQNLGMNEHVVV